MGVGGGGVEEETEKLGERMRERARERESKCVLGIEKLPGQGFEHIQRVVILLKEKCWGLKKVTIIYHWNM